MSYFQSPTSRRQKTIKGQEHGWIRYEIQWKIRQTANKNKSFFFGLLVLFSVLLASFPFFTNNNSTQQIYCSNITALHKAINQLAWLYKENWNWLWRNVSLLVSSLLKKTFFLTAKITSPTTTINHHHLSNKRSIHTFYILNKKYMIKNSV